MDVVPEGSIRVAVASNNGERLDGHFGSCLRFLVYQVGVDNLTLVDVRSALDTEFAEDRNGARAELIGDCQVLYVVSIGGRRRPRWSSPGSIRSRRPVARRGRFSPIFKASWLAIPPPWLAKLLGVRAEQRVRFERSDDEAACA